MVLGEKYYNEILNLLAGSLASHSPDDIARERLFENTGFYDGYMKDYDLPEAARWQMQSELGYEWASELSVMLPEDTGPQIPPGG